MESFSTITVHIPSSTSSSSPYPSRVRNFTSLLLSRQNLNTRLCVLEELVSKRRESLIVPTVSAKVLPSLSLSSSRKRSASTSSRKEDTKKVNSSVSRSTDAACPTTCIREEYEPPKRLQMTASATDTISTIVAQREQSTSSERCRKTWINQETDCLLLTSRTQNPVQSFHLGIPAAKPKSRQCGIAVTLTNYQETALELAVVELEIELVLLRESIRGIEGKERKKGVKSLEAVRKEEEGALRVRGKRRATK